MMKWSVAKAGVVAVLGILFAGCSGLGGARIGNILPTFSEQPAVLADSFDTADATGWTNDEAAAWQVIDGRYVALSSDDMATVALLSSSLATNSFVEVDYIRETNSVGAGGLVLRASSDFKAWKAGSGYLFGVGSDGTSWQAVIIRQEGGATRAVLPWTNVTAFASQTNRIGALVRNNLLQFYLNGALIWEGLDSGPKSGAAGLFGSTPAGYRTVHAFDSFQIKSSDPVLALPSGDREGGAGGEDAVAKTPTPASVASAASVAPAAGGVEKGAASSESPAVTSAPAGADVAGEPAVEDRSPILRPGFLIRVSVLVSGKREVDGEVKRVSANNMLDLPLIGAIPVEGVSLLKLRDMLEDRYSEFFINPQVVAEFVMEDRPDAISPWGQVVVLGRVRTPGRVNIPPTQDLTLSGAIQQAGGLDTSARSTAIKLTRKKEDGKTERITIDFNAIGQHGETGNDLLLKPGDTIFVPEKIF